MKNFLLFILLGSTIACATKVYADNVKQLATYPKAAVRHIFSTDGVKDLSAAYGVVMLMTLVHELGHSVMAKMLCGAPIDVVMGGARREGSVLKCAGIELAGLNPLKSSMQWKPYLESIGQSPSPKQQIAVSAAGILGQALVCVCIYRYLRNKDNFPVAKILALGGIADTVVGINGLLGALYFPNSCSAKIVANVKKIFCSKPS